MCPGCGNRVDSKDPGVVYAVSLEEAATELGSRTVTGGAGAYFHAACLPVTGYAIQRRDRPA